MSRLSEASARLWQTHDLRKGLEEMIAATIELLGADFGNIQLYDPKDRVLRIVVHRGFKPKFLDRFREVSVRDETACSRVLRTGRRIIIVDVEKDEPVAQRRAIARTAGYRAVQSTPLIARDGRALGIISTHFRSPHRPGELALQTLDLFVRQAADFIERCGIEQALRDQEGKLRLALDAASAGTWTWNAKTNETDWDDNFHALYGFTRKDPRTFRTWVSRLHKDDKARLLAAIEEMRGQPADGKWDVEFRAVGSNGSVAWHHALGRAVRDERGELARVDGILTDITPRRRMELALRERETWLEGQREALEAAVNGAKPRTSLGALVRTATDALGPGTRAAFYLSADGGGSLHVVGMSAAYARAVNGFKIGRQSRACGPAASAGRPVLTADVMEDARWKPWRWLAKRFDYRGCWTFPIRSSSGRVVGTLAIYSRQPRAATERELRLASLLTHTAAIIIAQHMESEARARAERAVLESEDRFRALVRASSDAVYRMSADWKEMRQLVGRDFIADTDKPTRAWPLKYIHPEDRPHVMAVIEKAVRTKGIFELEHRVLRPNGTLGWTFSRAIPILDSNGKVIEWFGMASDVTARKEAEEALRLSEHRLREAQRIGGVGTWEWDLRRGTTRWSPEIYVMHGQAPDSPAFTPEALLKCVHPEDQDRVKAAIVKAVSQGTLADLEYRTVRSDGSVRVIHALGAVAEFDARGKPVLMIGTNQDITARREAEAAVREQRDAAQRYFDIAGVILLALDVTGKVTRINRKGCEVLGCREGEIIGQCGFDRFLPARERSGAWKVFNDLIGRKGKTGESHANCVLTRHGAERLVAWQNRAVTDEKGRVLGTLSSGEDVTERRQAEVALHESEEHFRQVVESLPQLVWTCTDAGSCDYLSPQWMRYTGIGEAEQLGYGWLNQLHPDDRGRVRTQWQETASGQENFDGEFRIRRRDGVYRWFRTLAVPLRDERGRIVKWFGANMDIDAMKQAEEQRERALAEFDATVSCMTDGVMVFKRDGSLSFINPAMERMLHCPPQARGWSLADWWKRLTVTREDGTPLLSKDSLTLKALGGERVKPALLCVRIPGGRPVWVLSSAAAMKTAGGECIGAVTVFANVTEQRRAGEALREREERMRAILNTVVDAVITVDYRGIIVGTNPAAERMFGYAAAEMAGRNVKMLMPSPHREEHDRYIKNYHRTGVRKIINGGRELQAQRKDGTVFPVELSVTEVDHMHLFTGVIRDITARKELERAVSEAAEREQNRIGQELHDGICQELTGIELHLCSLARKLQSRSSEEAAAAAEIAASVRRAMSRTRKLSHGLSPLISKSEGLMGALRELADNISGTYSIQCSFLCPSPVLLKDTLASSHLCRIAQEAVSNAVRHGKAKRVEIALRKHQDNIFLSVKDNGIGLPAAQFQGAGIGLRVMKYRAGLINGSLEIKGRPEGGTSVICTVPLPSSSKAGQVPGKP